MVDWWHNKEVECENCFHMRKLTPTDLTLPVKFMRTQDALFPIKLTHYVVYVIPEVDNDHLLWYCTTCGQLNEVRRSLWDKLSSIVIMRYR